MEKIRRNALSLKSLSVASVKMYFRNVIALFFTLFIPVLLILIFGLLNIGGSSSTFDVSVTNLSKTDLAKQFVDGLKKVDGFKVHEVSEQEAADKLGKGKTDLQVVVPEDFGTVDQAHLKSTQIKAYYNEGRPQQGVPASLVLRQIVTGINDSVNHTPQTLSFDAKGVKTNNQGFLDFLVPGIMAMSIMQLGIFSVAFGFISYKTTGALRRLKATPTHPINFIIAQSVARLIIGVLQVCILLLLGFGLFHLHLIGSVLNLLIVATLGNIVFLAFGFCIAGWAKEENQAAPVANLITFPMLFLSGVFFPRDGFPGWLKTVTNFFPLTYLSDAMHRIANEGAGLGAVRGDLLGMAVWGILVFILAVLLFRWE